MERGEKEEVGEFVEFFCGLFLIGWKCGILSMCVAFHITSLSWKEKIIIFFNFFFLITE